MARKVLPRFSLPLQPSAYRQPGGRRSCATPGQARPSASRVVPSVRLPEPLRCVPGFLVLAMLGSAQGRPAPFHSSSVAASVSPAVSPPKPCCSHEKDREHAVSQTREPRLLGIRRHGGPAAGIGRKKRNRGSLGDSLEAGDELARLRFCRHSTPAAAEKMPGEGGGRERLRVTTGLRRLSFGTVGDNFLALQR